MAIMNNTEMYPKNEIGDMFKVDPPNFSIKDYENTPHAVLADTNLPIYITTNYDTLMEEALMNRGKDMDKKPVSEYCRWNPFLEEFAEDKSIFNNDPQYKPTVNRPLVYHLHGRIDVPESLVLTERDYIDFIINMSKEERRLPQVIRKALATTSLLFVGYSLEDINFRVIYQGIMSMLSPSYQLPSVAVQLPPSISEMNKHAVIEYLNKYTKNMFKVDVFWGDAEEFVVALRKLL